MTKAQEKIFEKAYKLAAKFAKTGNLEDRDALEKHVYDHDIFMQMDDDRVYIEDDYFMYQFLESFESEAWV